MQEIPLCNSELKTQVSDEDFEFLGQFRWWLNLGYAHTYVLTHSGLPFAGLGVAMHRMLLPKACSNQVIDHINRNKLDNQRANLRLATKAQNSFNRSPIKGKKFAGIQRSNANRWVASVSCSGVYWTHPFPTERLAAIGRDVMAANAFGEFACLNIPTPEPNEIRQVSSALVEAGFPHNSRKPRPRVSPIVQLRANLESARHAYMNPAPEDNGNTLRLQLEEACRLYEAQLAKG